MSADVPPPPAEQLIADIHRTVDHAKNMPHDCPEHLREFFDEVRVRAHASDQQHRSCLGGQGGPEARLVCTASRTLGLSRVSLECTLHAHAPPARPFVSDLRWPSPGAARATDAAT